MKYAGELPTCYCAYLTAVAVRKLSLVASDQYQGTRMSWQASARSQPSPYHGDCDPADKRMVQVLPQGGRFNIVSSLSLASRPLTSPAGRDPVCSRGGVPQEGGRGGGHAEEDEGAGRGRGRQEPVRDLCEDQGDCVHLTVVQLIRASLLL